MGQPSDRRADEIHAGDFIKDGRGFGPVEITHVQPHRNAHGDERILLVTSDAAVSYHPADELVTLATEDDRAEHEQDARRQGVASTLRQIADLIVEERIPMPLYGLRMGWMVRSSASIRDVAKRLGWTLDEPTPDHHHVAVERVFGVVTPTSVEVEVRLHAQEAPTVEPDAFAEASARAAEPEQAATDPFARPPHYEARGWKGAGLNQGCGVECACGETYDGFDSLAEANALLSKHIKEGNAKAAVLLEQPLDSIPADFGADHDPTQCECEDCDDEIAEDERCPSCGEPWALLRSGAVGHSGDEHGNDCPADKASKS